MKLHAGDWLWNASLVGYLRIQKARFDNGNGGPWERYEEELEKEDFIDIQPEDLNGFAEAYFVHNLSKTYSSMLRKFSFSDSMNKKIEKDKVESVIRNVKRLRDEIEKSVKFSYTSYEESCNDCVQKVENYRKSVSDIVNTEIKDIFPKKQLEDRIIKELSKLKKNKPLPIEDEIENLIWGVSSRFYHNDRVLTQGKKSWGKWGKNQKEAFNEVYVKSAQLSITEKAISNPQSQTYSCRFCKSNQISTIDNYSFFSERNFKPSGTSPETFANHFYFLQSDLIMCELCRLVLFCTWAGLNKIPIKMIDGVNDTEYSFVSIPSMLITWEENEKIANEFEKSKINTKNMIYEIVMEDLFLRRQRMKSVWVLQNTLFVEIKPESQKNKAIPKVTTFNIGKDIANMFAKDEISIRTLTNMRGKLKFRGNPTVKRNDDIWINVKRDVVRRLLSNETLYPISEAILRNRIEAPQSSSMETLRKISLISSIRAVNSEKLNVGGYIMESRTVHGIINSYARIGKQLAEEIDFERRRRLSYRLLSNIRSGCVEDFYDGIMKLYIDKGISIPDNMIGLLNREDEIRFEDKAYAFMSGFLRDQNEPKVEQNQRGDDE